jgi:sulfur carrier protein ThiS
MVGMTDVDYLLTEAARVEAENMALKRQVADLLREVEILSVDVAALVGQEAVKKRQDQGAQKGPLASMCVAVIGPSFKSAVYEAAIRELGGRCRYGCSDEKVSTISRAMKSAHGAIFLTGFASHVADDHVRAAEYRYGIPVVRLGHGGVASFRNAVLNELLPAMRWTKENRRKCTA